MLGSFLYRLYKEYSNRKGVDNAYFKGLEAPDLGRRKSCPKSITVDYGAFRSEGVIFWKFMLGCSGGFLLGILELSRWLQIGYYEFL